MAFNTGTDKLYGQLRDCFSGGYRLPQYCLEHNIKYPLLVGYQSEWLWELYAQFRYDNRITATVATLAIKDEAVNISPACVLSLLHIQTIEKTDVSKYDMIFIFETSWRCPASITEKWGSKKFIYLEEIVQKFVQHVYAEIPLYHYLSLNPGVKVIVIDYPIMNKKCLSEYEQMIIAEGDIHKLRGKLSARKNKEITNRFDRFGYNNEEVLNLLELTDAKRQLDGTTVLVDSTKSLIGVENGKRKTAHQPQNYKNSIYFMGTCTYYGIGAPYDKTVESYLQEQLNEHGQSFRVVNASQFYAGRYQDLFYNLWALSAIPGDIIFICLQGLHADGIPFFNSRHLFDRPHDYGEVFADETHLNECGYEILAKKIYEDLENHNFYHDYTYHFKESAGLHIYGIPGSVSLGGQISVWMKPCRANLLITRKSYIGKDSVSVVSL